MAKNSDDPLNGLPLDLPNLEELSIYDSKYQELPQNQKDLLYGGSDILVYLWWSFWDRIKNPKFPGKIPTRLIIVTEKENEFRYRHPAYRLIQLQSEKELNKINEEQDILEILNRENYRLSEVDLYALSYMAFGEFGYLLVNKNYHTRYNVKKAKYTSTKEHKRDFQNWLGSLQSEYNEDLTVYRDIRKTQNRFKIIDEFTNYIDLNLLQKYSDYKEAKPTRKKQIDQAIKSALYEIYSKGEEYRFLKNELQLVSTYEELEKFFFNTRFDRSELKVMTESFQFKPKYLGRHPRVEDGEDIFNQVILSPYVTSAQYVAEPGPGETEPRILFKIFGQNGGDKILVKNKVFKRTKGKKSTLDPGVLTLRLWLGGKGDSTNYLSASKDTFTNILYDLKDNLLQVVTGNIGSELQQSDILERISNALPTIQLAGHEVKEIKVTYNIYDAHLTNYVLTHLIVNDPFFRTYIISNENLHPLMLKKAFEITYRGQSKIDIHITNRELERKLINVPIYDAKDVVSNETIRSRTPYLNVILSADSLTTIKEFIRIFRLLLIYYRFVETRVKKLYASFGLDKLKQEEKVVDVKIKTFERLKQQFPEVFQTGYATLCAGKKQPIIIPTNEVAAWEAQTFKFGGKTYYRQAMPYPANTKKPLFYFGSGPGSEDYPFPQLVINTLPNKDKYPLVPCLGASDMMNDKNSNFNRWREGLPFIVKTQQGISTKIKHLPDPYHEVRIPTSIFNLIRNVKEEKNFEITPNDLVALGVTRSTSSLLHCVLVAVGNIQYLNLRTHIERELFVQRMRKEIAAGCNPSILRQELYDRTNEQIITEIADPSIHLDPDLYYRALEEFFNINIFCFFIPTEHNRAGYGEMVIPRHKLFYVSRKDPNRGSILINTYRDKKFPVPQNTIIILKQDEDAIYIFGKKVTQVCINALVQRADYYLQINGTPQIQGDLWVKTSRSSPETQDPSQNKSSSSRVELDLAKLRAEFNSVTYNTELIKAPGNFNLFNHIELEDVTQQIDFEGKCYALSGRAPVLTEYLKGSKKTKQITDKSNYITFYIPRTQPYDFPEEPIEYPTTLEYAKLVLDLNPSYQGVNWNGKVTGYWFAISGVGQSLFVPTRSEPIDPKLSIVPDPVISEAKNQNDRIIKLRRDISLIKQLLLWLYSSRYTSYQIEYGLAFIKECWVYDQDNTQLDTSRYYDFSDLPHDLAIYDTSIETLENLVPSFAQNGKLFFCNQEFYYRMGQLFMTQIRTWLNLPTQVNSEIQNYYQTVSDFRKQDHVTVLIGKREIDYWIKEVFNSDENQLIYRKIPKQAPTFTEPFIYEKWPGVYFLVQNTKEKGLSYALNLCVKWNQEQTNYGPEITKLAKNQYPPYVINGVSSTGTLFLEEDHAKSQENEYDEVLHYEGLGYIGEYAAMLRIY